MTQNDVAGAWSLIGARQAGGRWSVKLARPVEVMTTIGELVATLAEATPRAYEAVISVDLRNRRERTATATVYVRDRDEAKAFMSGHRGPVTIHES